MQVSSCTRPSCSSDLVREEQLHTRRSLKHSCREVSLAFSRCCIVQTLIFGTSVSSDMFKNHDAQALPVSDHDALDHDVDSYHDKTDHVGDHHALAIMP